MTTNQTIDGVLVSRDLALRIIECISYEEADELRALLDAPTPFPGYPPVPEDRKLPASQPQGEPVAIYQAEFLGEGGGGWSDVEHAEYLSLRSSPEFRLRIVYAEQPAPVATIALIVQAIHDTPEFPGITGIQIRQLAERLNVKSR